MKNIYQLILFSLLLLTSQTSLSQKLTDLPEPIRYYKLNGGNLNGSVSNKNGTLGKGTVSAYTDRFGNANGATQLNNARIETPSFFNMPSEYQNGFSISFWTYLDEHISKLTGGNEPWLPSDIPYQAFYTYGGSATSPVPLLGLERRRDRMLLNWVSTIDNQRKPWDIWLWDPVNFTNQQGWYHIIAVYELRRTTVYIYKPDGEEAAAAHYFTIPNLSDAREWGLGGHDHSPLKVMSDFKVFNRALSNEQVRQLHANEAPPAGMYNVSLAADPTQYLHTQEHSESSSARAEILRYNDTYSKTYEWVFEPVQGKTNVYRIRMAYSDQYLHLYGHSISNGQVVQILSYNSSYADTYEWKIEPDRDDNTFFIRNNKDDQYYLHTTGHSIANGTALEILRYNSSYPNTYKWKLNLIKTKYELAESYSMHDGLISPSHDTVLRMTGYFQSEKTLTARNFVSQHIGWTVTKNRDDAYTINNQVSGLYLHPTNANPFSRNNLVETLSSSDSDVNSQWVLEKPNKYYDKYVFRHARSRPYVITPTKIYPSVNGTLSGMGSYPGNLTYESWVFTEGGYSNGIVRNQAYILLPGIYRISITLNGETRYVTTSGHSTADTSPLTTAQFIQGTKYFDWKITFEEKEGQPIRDGSYLLQHVNSGRYMHITSHYDALSTGQEIQILNYNDSYPAAYKFILQPAGGGKIYMIPTALSTGGVETKAYASDTKLCLGNLLGNPNVDNYQWTFEKIADITATGEIIYLDEPVEVTFPDSTSDYKPSH
ncbi:MAG: RICIN domain-containing protein [Bacteroides sp.]|nr:RICIN domain-containing protein [Bacteroides sp.]